MEASLTCAVCLSLFEEPVTLPVCSHNFCRPCVVECLSLSRSSAEAASRPPPQHPRDPPQESGPSPPPGRAPRDREPVTVSCPLCRKPSPLPADGGGGGAAAAAAALPVNTTLAEVVKLFRASLAAKPAQDATPEEASSALAPQLASLGVPCEKHPGRALQLYCRRCLRGACGQCVSEEHQGIFHSVNLIDTVYQEEKLAFFSNLKKIRELHENLIKAMSVSPNDARVVMLNEEEIIKTEFEKVYNALEVRKKQLLEEVELQKNRKLKESLIWKRMKEVHRKTIENVLNDCEKLLSEYDPQRFLEVACNLNQRMKTQLELMQIACSHESQSERKQIQMDTTNIVNDILALNLTALSLDVVKDIPSRDVEHSVSASPGNQWKDQENVQNTFYPVPGEDIVLDNGRNIPTQYMSLSAATEFGSISHEEMRYNYYMKHQVCLDEIQAQTSPQKEEQSLLKCLSSKSTTSGLVLSCLSAEGKSKKKLKVPSLRRPCFNEAGLSNSVGFTFDAQAVNLNFCGSSSKLNLHNVNQSQNDAKEMTLSALSSNCPNTISVQSHAETLHSEGLFSFTRFPVLPETAALASIATVKPYVPGAKHSASPLISGPIDSVGITAASKASALTFEKEKEAFSSISPETSNNQDCNVRTNINGYNSSDSTTGFLTVATSISAISPQFGTANSGSPFSSMFPDNSESNSCSTTTVNSSEEKPFSCLIADQKILQENKAVCFKRLKNKNSWCTSSVSDSNKHLVCNSSDTFPMACTASTAYMMDATKKQPVPDSISSKNNSYKNGTPCLGSFKEAPKNCGDTLTFIKNVNKAECITGKSKMKSKDKNLTLQKSVPSKKDVASYKELQDMRHSSFVSVNKNPKPETCVLLPQQVVAYDLTANSNSISIKPTKRENPLEIPPPAIEDHRAFSSIPDRACSTINSDSDIEDSQASNISDSSSTSEYFSVAEDKISH